MVTLIRLAPNETGKGVDLEDKIVGVIPREYIKPTFDGIKEASQNGVIAGYPVIDFKVELYDGSFHEVSTPWKWLLKWRGSSLSRMQWQKPNQSYLSLS